MVKIFYAKIKLFNPSVKSFCNTQIALKTYGSDELDAEENVSKLIETWSNIEQYEIEKISSRPINIDRFVIIATLKYSSGIVKNIKYNTRAEDKKDAEKFFREALDSWHQVVGIEIHTIQKRF